MTTAFELPRKFGRFLLFDRIGQGGMAELYLGRQATVLGGGKHLAVKLILPVYAERADLAEMLIAEAKVAATLSHGNIVQVVDLGREEGRLFIAMEFVEGLDLSTLLKRCSKEKVPLPPELALRVVCELLAALDYAAKKNVVHRDVSPSNVLLSFDGEVKLCDFGIARVLGELEGGDASIIKGKAGYMSPEQARGDELDARADLFAAGIILWELLSGKKLYRGGDLIALARTAEIPDLDSRGLPDEGALFGIVKKALSPSRDDRFANAGEMRRALLDWAAKAGLAANPIKLGAWLEQHFGTELLAQRNARAASARALEPSPEPPRITYKPDEDHGTQRGGPGPQRDELVPESLSPVDISPSSRQPPPVAPKRGPWVWVGAAAIAVSVVVWLLSR